MEVVFKTAWFEIRQTAGTTEEAFAALATMAEVFGKMTCGKCGGPAKPVHRLSQGYDFYSMNCTKCGAELKFGQRKKEKGGGLFPKTFDERGPLKDGGWGEPFGKRENAQASAQ